jgi:hypothetical protein
MSTPKIWIRLHTRDGSERTAPLRLPAPDEEAAEVVGYGCPCGARPLRVKGTGRRPAASADLARDTYEADAVSACCGGSVGTIYAQVDTLFGLEEDEAVLAYGRCRVY